MSVWLGRTVLLEEEAALAPDGEDDFLDEGARIPAAFLEEERKAQGERWFRQEYMCEFMDLREGVFDMGVVERALTDEVEPLDLDGGEEGKRAH